MVAGPSPNMAFSANDDVPGGFAEVLTVTAFGDRDGKPGGLDVPVNCGEGMSFADDALLSTTNGQGSAVDLAAPGACVEQIGSAPHCSIYYATGTSFAAPLVSGAIALHLGETWQSPPSPDQVLTTLQQRADVVANQRFLSIGKYLRLQVTGHGAVAGRQQGSQVPDPELDCVEGATDKCAWSFPPDATVDLSVKADPNSVVQWSRDCAALGTSVNPALVLDQDKLECEVAISCAAPRDWNGSACICPNQCAPGEVPDAACQCQCPTGTRRCQGACVNDACPNGTFNTTTCDCGCNAGFAWCGGQCVNAQCGSQVFSMNSCGCVDSGTCKSGQEMSLLGTYSMDSAGYDSRVGQCVYDTYTDEWYGWIQQSWGVNGISTVAYFANIGGSPAATQAIIESSNGSPTIACRTQTQSDTCGTILAGMQRCYLALGHGNSGGVTATFRLVGTTSPITLSMPPCMP